MSEKVFEIRRSRIFLAVLGAVFAATGWAQTSGGTTTTQTTVVTTATSPSGEHDARYVQSVDGRFGAFAGSTENLQSLATGLRHGTEITLVGSGGESLSFTPPTRPMGYGNITHALDLSSRQLAALGITDPTAEEIRAAMLGGTVTAPDGDVTLQGVLQLRSQGMGWGQIAHTLGLKPGRQASTSTTPTATGASGAAAATRTAAQANRGSGQSGIVTAGGNAFGHGAKAGAGVTTGLGASAGSGPASAQGRGNGRGGK